MDRILDYLIIVIYLISITHIGILSEDRQKSIKNYLLGARSILWWFVLFSIVDAESGNWTLISIPGFAYFSNLNFLQFAFETIVGRIFITGLLGMLLIDIVISKPSQTDAPAGFI